MALLSLPPVPGLAPGRLVRDRSYDSIHKMRLKAQSNMDNYLINKINNLEAQH